MSTNEPQAGMAYELELARKRIAEMEGALANRSRFTHSPTEDKPNDDLAHELGSALSSAISLSKAPNMLGVYQDAARAVYALIAVDHAKQAAELSRLRSLVSHIRSLAPNGTRGLGSIMNDVFDAVEKFDRGGAVVDPRDAELERLRRSVESAICWLEGRKNHGEHWAITEALNNLKRVSAPAAKAEPQAAPMPHFGDPWDCGGGK